MKMSEEIELEVEEQVIEDDMIGCLIEEQFQEIAEEVMIDDEEEEVVLSAENGIDFEDEEIGEREEEENSENELLIDASAADGKVGENQVYQWSAFTGLRVKSFSADELSHFRRPFELGWRREVVLRGTVTTSGKKIGDVYYFSPDKKTKLRSYVEMGLFLKKASSGLAPENFTFARQPIYRPPQEIVRHAMQRGGGTHTLTASHIIDSAPFTPAVAAVAPVVTEEAIVSPSASRSARNSTASESEEQFSMSIAEGRAKRKRVAPTRFEDEDYSESPLKKKGQRGERPSIGSNGVPTANPVSSSKSSNSNQKPTIGPKPQLSLQEKRRQLQHQLLQQVHEQTMKKAALETANKAPTVTPPNGENVEIAEKSEKVEKPEIIAEKSEEKSPEINAKTNVEIPDSKPTEEKPEIAEKEDEKEPKVEEEKTTAAEVMDNSASTTSGAPCSMHCPGRRGMLPNLMCSRCFCLYHLDCVPKGVFLEEPRVFVCPNCLKPEDTTRSAKTNGFSSDNSESLLIPKTQLFVQNSAPIQIPIKSRSTFAPILPKPPNLQNQHIFQQTVKHKRQQFSASTPLAPFNKSAAMNVKLPIGTHLYRVATGPNGHSMIVKDKSIKPKVATTAAAQRPNGNPKRAPQLSSLPHYKPAPIAPIGPMKHTPQELERQLRRFLEPAVKDRKKRGYRDWMDRRRSTVTSLVTPYACLNHVLAYLTVADLVRLRHVSRDWLHLSSQPFLWRCVRLKGIQINDWLFLARNIIEVNASLELDFDAVKSGSDLCDFWRNFSTIVDYIKSVRTLRFGAIPTFVLEEVVNAAVTDNPYNSFAHLETLSVRNCFEEESEAKQCSLHFLSDFQTLKGLKSLHVNSKNGFSGDSDSVQLLSNVFSEMALQSLVMTSLKDFSSRDFVFLRSLNRIESLEIGSCQQWFQTDDDVTAEDNQSEADGLKGAFLYLSELQTLRTLRLVDISIDDLSTSLPKTLESLSNLESLTIDNLRVEASGVHVLDTICAVIGALPLTWLSVSTGDPHSNRLCCEMLKKCDQKSLRLEWKVEVLVEDSGECFVPFHRDDDNADDADVEGEAGEEARDVRYMDLTFLNELIQSELSHASIEIIPQ